MKCEGLPTPHACAKHVAEKLISDEMRVSKPTHSVPPDAI